MPRPRSVAVRIADLLNNAVAALEKKAEQPAGLSIDDITALEKLTRINKINTAPEPPEEEKKEVDPKKLMKELRGAARDEDNFPKRGPKPTSDVENL